MQDPIIVGATRRDSVLELAHDPEMQSDCIEAASIKIVFDNATRQIEDYKEKFRKYGWDKRHIWNRLNETDPVATVKIPYELGSQNGEELRFITVVCANKYIVEQNKMPMIKKEFKSEYKKLFLETEVEFLREEAHAVLRAHFKDIGFEGPRLKAIWDQLFEKQLEIKTIENFETEFEKVTDEYAKLAISSVVTRQKPAVTIG